jgi:hypothetical protein
LYWVRHNHSLIRQSIKLSWPRFWSRIVKTKRLSRWTSGKDLSPSWRPRIQRSLISSSRSCKTRSLKAWCSGTIPQGLTTSLPLDGLLSGSIVHQIPRSKLDCKIASFQWPCTNYWRSKSLTRGSSRTSVSHTFPCW